MSDSTTRQKPTRSSSSTVKYKPENSGTGWRALVFKQQCPCPQQRQRQRQNETASEVGCRALAPPEQQQQQQQHVPPRHRAATSEQDPRRQGQDTTGRQTCTTKPRQARRQNHAVTNHTPSRSRNYDEIKIKSRTDVRNLKVRALVLVYHTYHTR